jgi:hypothetical protein
MFIELLLISAILLVISFAGMGIRMILKPGTRFPETHISRNKEMQKRGITCAQKTDIGCLLSESMEGCATCGKVRV